MKELNQMALESNLRYQPTGSRYICTPPVLDTDEDYIVLTNKEPNYFEGKGYEQTSEDGYLSLFGSDAEQPSCFRTYRKGEVNLIVTGSVVFYTRFCEATQEAKKLNLLSKQDRIGLFQKRLYDQEIPL